MSLIAWYPLTNNINNNYGTHTANTLSATTFADNGVIGQCLSTNSKMYETGLERSQSWDLLTSNLSISCWLKINKDEIATVIAGTTVTEKAHTPTGTIAGHNSYSGFALTWTSNTIYPSNAFTTFKVMATARGLNSAGGAASYNTGSYSMPFDTWVHLVATYDRVNNVLGLYVNGKPHSVTSKSLNSIVSLNKDARTFRINANQVYGGNGPSQLLPLKLNDVRLYDHTLSQNEILELSKGLLLHYNFNDSYSTNLCNWRNKSTCNMTGWSGSIAYENEELLLTATNGWRAFLWDIGEANINKTITFSFDYKVTDASNAGWLFVQHYASVYYGNDVGRLNINATDWVRHSVTIPNCQRYVGINLRGTDNTGKSIQLKVKNVKIALSDTDNIYSEYNINFTNVTDNSGYGYDGNANALSYSSNSPKNMRAAVFNGNTSYIEVPWIKQNLWTSNYTLSFWVNPDDNGRAIYFGDYGLTGGSLINFERKDGGAFRYWHGGDPDKTVSGLNAAVGEWTMLSVTYTPGTMKFYKNGQLIETYSHTSTQTKTSGKMYIGKDNRDGATALAGKMSDFRLYGTTLTDEDILNLYNNPCSFDNQQNIFTNIFQEENVEDIDINQNFIMIAKEFNEETEIGLFDDGKVTSNHLYEI